MKPLARIISFVLDQAAAQPVAGRIALYRDLAAISGSRSRATELMALADELEAIERRCRQLRLDLGDDQNGGQHE